MRAGHEQVAHDSPHPGVHSFSFFQNGMRLLSVETIASDFVLNASQACKLENLLFHEIKVAYIIK